MKCCECSNHNVTNKKRKIKTTQQDLRDSVTYLRSQCEKSNISLSSRTSDYIL